MQSLVALQGLTVLLSFELNYLLLDASNYADIMNWLQNCLPKIEKYNILLTKSHLKIEGNTSQVINSLSLITDQSMAVC